MSVSHLRLRLLSLVLLGTLAGQASATQASLPKPGDLDLIRDRQERLLEEQRRRLEELQELPGKQISPGVPVQAADSRCFPIQEIQLKGADSLSANERDTMFQPYIGQCLGVSQLNELLKVITNHYIDRGLVTTRAYLPQQDLSQGHLQMLVVEGKLESLKGADNSKLLDVAKGIIDQLAAQKIPLKWNDGSQIVANGDKVFAFNATEKQFNDSTLFSSSISHGQGTVYDQWRQYGQDKTSEHSKEIGQLSSAESNVRAAAQRLSDLASKGILTVSPELDAAMLLMPAGKGAKAVVETVLEKIAAGKASAVVGAKDVVSKINVNDLRLTKTVENHLRDLNKAGDRVRPYGDSRALMQEIMSAKPPLSDPRGVPGALRWDVQGEMNGSNGSYELVVDQKTNTVLHFLFKSASK